MAKVLRECLQPLPYSLVAIFDNNQNLISPFPDIPLYFGKTGFESWLNQRNSNLDLANTNLFFLVAMGGDWGRGKDRLEIQEYLKNFGLIPLLAKHQNSFVADNVTIGEGSQIFAQAAVCVETQIGRACVINTGATVDHECRLGDGVHIAPGAHLAGCIEVERYAMIGTGAVVLPRLKIGEGAMVGAGAVVTKDVLPYTVVVGNPARAIRTWKSSEKDEKNLGQ